uniref:Protein kinase domain-containing protein n=1 Tax=Steinernema glaseri TaxID=37863 RepID=A0A1I8AAB9_9BILA
MRLLQSLVLPLCLTLILCSSSVNSASCPTLGITSYVLVYFSSDCQPDGFTSMLEVFANLTAECDENFKHELHFGFKQIYGSTRDSLYNDIQEWKNSETDEVGTLLNDSKATPSDALASLKAIKNLIDSNNRDPPAAVKKKTLTIVSDFIDKELFETVNNLTGHNIQLFVLTNWEKLDETMTEFKNVNLLMSTENENLFCKDIPYELHTSHKSARANINIYLSESSDLSKSAENVAGILQGDLCTLPNSTKVMSEYAKVYHGEDSIFLPWVQEQTSPFAKHCVSNLPKPRTKTRASRSAACGQNEPFYNNLYKDLTIPSQLPTYNVFIGEDVPDCLISMISTVTQCPTCTNIFLDVLIDGSYLNSLTVYSHVFKPLSNTNIFSPHRDNHVTTNTKDLTVCRAMLPAKPLHEMKPYTPPKSLSRALERFFLIILIATTSVTATGAFFYRKLYTKRMELLEEMRELALQPGAFKKAKECPKVARLPWEIKSDRIHLDHEFPLGEGTISVVYLGKLKGKSPIMQWIDRVEMKQFQDCAVAVRVPRRFDEMEEQQLLREINSMKVLKHHTYINVLLGWTSKDNLVCTVLELTHTNLTKYLAQLRDGVSSSETALTASLIPYRHFLQINWQICEAMVYITSKGLVHRDMAARNILLTTGLRVKVSGFGFCSEATDPAFAPGAPTINSLPVRWIAPEAMEGRFSESSDVWSFGIMLDEMYSLGEKPYGEMVPEEFVQAIKCGERLRKPEFASEEMYSIMVRCWHKYPERRPRFTELQERFHSMIEHYHDNPAFELSDS